MTTEILTTIAGTRAVLDRHRADGHTVGFVPTMGYLHDGHGSLIRAARAETDMVIVSIFVNPLQFGAGEDLAAYPRDLERDWDVAAANGADLMFHPATEEMYPDGAVLTSVTVGDLSERWDGESRPTHFAGVATVVSKLFNIIGPCRAYFGEKDFQQLTVVQRMVADLSTPVDVVGCPTVREPDGVAMSSRNSYLSPEDRAAAVVVRRALDAGRAAFADGQHDPTEVATTMADVVADEDRATLDYVAVVDPDTLQTAAAVDQSTRLLIAVTLGTTRLIDNDAAGGPEPTPRMPAMEGPS